ncbi:hypothetical protein FRB95_002682 [Tulasnella sp. JGI-2019a]|nr:hypothetical protein FRB95_002682 [Tulasnella sp. JGI-2019a]
MIRIGTSQKPMQSIPPQFVRATGFPAHEVIEGPRSRSQSRSMQRARDREQEREHEWEQEQEKRRGRDSERQDEQEREREREMTRETEREREREEWRKEREEWKMEREREMMEREREAKERDQPPTLVQLQIHPASVPFEPQPDIRLHEATPAVQPVPEIVRIVREPQLSPPPTVIQIERPQHHVEGPLIIHAGKLMERHPTPPLTVVRIEGPTVPAPQPPTMPSVVKIISPLQPSRSRSSPPPQKVQVVVPEPRVPTIMRIQSPSAPPMAPSPPAVVRIQAPTPTKLLLPPPVTVPVMIPVPSVVRIDARAFQKPVVEAEARTRIETPPPPTIIQVPDVTAPQELPAMMRFEKSMSQPKVEPAIAPTAPVTPTMPTVVRIHAPPPITMQPPFSPSFIWLKSPPQGQPIPIVVRAPQNEMSHLRPQYTSTIRIVPTIIDVDGAVSILTGGSTLELQEVVSLPSSRSEAGESRTEGIPPSASTG